MGLIDVSVSGHVATLVLNNPDERNTLTQPMVLEIIEAVDRIEADDDVSALIVTGAPPAFCAGAKLGDLGPLDPSSSEYRERVRWGYEGFLRIARSTLPTIAAVNGAAVGAGMNLALGCDVRLASRRAKFDSRFVQLGLHPGGGHTWLFQGVAGQQAAAAGILFGQVFDGEASARVGLALACVEEDALLGEAMALAERAAAAPRELLLRTKATLRGVRPLDEHDAAIEHEMTPQIWSTQQPWFAERVAAMQAKISSSR